VDNLQGQIDQYPLHIIPHGQMDPPHDLGNLSQGQHFPQGQYLPQGQMNLPHDLVQGHMNQHLVQDPTQGQYPQIPDTQNLLQLLKYQLHIQQHHSQVTNSQLEYHILQLINQLGLQKYSPPFQVGQQQAPSCIPQISQQNPQFLSPRSQDQMLGQEQQQLFSVTREKEKEEDLQLPNTPDSTNELLDQSVLLQNDSTTMLQGAMNMQKKTLSIIMLTMID
jgi:hypothetical protein